MSKKNAKYLAKVIWDKLRVIRGGRENDEGAY